MFGRKKWGLAFK